MQDVYKIASDERLLEWLNEQRVELAAANDLIEELTAEIQRRHAAAVEQAYVAKGEQSGKVTVDLPGGLQAVATRTKRVEWDQPKLFAVAEAMDPQEAHHWFDFKVGMSEKKYDALPATHKQHALVQEARVVKYGPLKIELVKKE